jgi:hypothetical protein
MEIQFRSRRRMPVSGERSQLNVCMMPIGSVYAMTRAVAAGSSSRAFRPDHQNRIERISMLRRGGALGVLVGSSKAVCAVIRARPSFAES